MSMSIVPTTTGMVKFLTVDKKKDPVPYKPGILLFGKLWEFNISYANEQDAYQRAGEIADALERQVRGTIEALQKLHNDTPLAFGADGKPTIEHLPPVNDSLKKLLTAANDILGPAPPKEGEE